MKKTSIIIAACVLAASMSACARGTYRTMPANTAAPAAGGRSIVTAAPRNVTPVTPGTNLIPRTGTNPGFRSIAPNTGRVTAPATDTMPGTGRTGTVMTTPGTRMPATASPAITTAPRAAATPRVSPGIVNPSIR